MKRKIKRIIIHCSASSIPHHDNIDIIDDWHRQRGFNGVGYHYFINAKGTIQLGRKLELQGAHVKGHNSDTIGICLHGYDDFTPNQLETLERLCQNLIFAFKIPIESIFGHYELDSKKSCPNIYMPGFREKLNGIYTSS